MKIALVHNAYGRISGEEVVIDCLVRLLAERGDEVVRFSRSSAEIGDSLAGMTKAFFAGIHNPLAAAAFREFLSREKPDVVHVHNVYPLISPSILPVCRAAGVPVVMTVHNFRLVCPNGLLLCRGELCHRCVGGREWHCVLRNCENGFLKSLGYAIRTATARMTGRFTRHVDRFICLTEFQRDILVGAGLPRERMRVVPNPVRLGVPFAEGQGDGDFVGYVGRISPERDLQALVSAARALPGIPFRIAGDCEHTRDAFGSVPGNCVFVGHVGQDDLPDFYRSCRFIVLPTRCYEGFPTVILEAAEMGRTVVASRIGGLGEIVDDGVSGLLYDPGDTDDLTRTIADLWHDATRCAELGSAARARWQELYDPGILLERIVSEYRRVTSDRPSP